MAIIDAGVTGPLLREAMESIRAGLNPHPAGQKTLNVPSYDGEQVSVSVVVVVGTLLRIVQEKAWIRWVHNNIRTRADRQQRVGYIVQLYIRRNKTNTTVRYPLG